MGRLPGYCTDRAQFWRVVNRDVFTGFTDVDNQEIYENDLLLFNGTHYLVNWKDGQFLATDKNGLNLENLSQGEVVANLPKLVAALNLESTDWKKMGEDFIRGLEQGIKSLKEFEEDQC